MTNHDDQHEARERLRAYLLRHTPSAQIPEARRRRHRYRSRDAFCAVCGGAAPRTLRAFLAGARVAEETLGPWLQEVERHAPDDDDEAASRGGDVDRAVRVIAERRGIDADTLTRLIEALAA